MNEFNYPEFIGKTEVRDRKKVFYPIQSLSALLPSDRPREKLCNFGPEALSDHELLTVVLNTGIRGKNVVRLAAELLEQLDGSNGIPMVREMMRLTGMGENKAGAVAAMLEFGRRRWGAAGIKISHPGDVFSLIRHHADRKQERFLCLSLNGAHEVLAVRVVTVGLVNRTIVHPREVYAETITDHAVAVVVAHNHPSGQLIPSKEDDEVTTRLNIAADILGINFLDHIIFSDTAYFSYRQSNRLGISPAPDEPPRMPQT
ncbi:MAG: DNA repair protein RadC [Treponema sp.]|jgi:DNA repair protein RadC|nr:DNA repair protein RadC [Treponema sp.]